ncbi:MAG: hypothetical protein JNJ82_04650 [Opitutaceae bacterium]|nr:hypothetical protein [Opitutaceae bacterium]
MKKLKNMKFPTVLLAALTLSGCAHTRYYAPVLMEKEAKGSKYSAVYANGIHIKRSTESAKKFANIEIKAIRPGFLHRSKGGDRWSKRETANAWKDRDLWVLIQVEGLEGNDLFEAKIDRKAVFSHVVMNAASYDVLTVDIQPIPVELNKVHRIKAKIYSIDKFLLRKAIFESKDKSLGKWALDSVSGLGKAVGNIFAREAFDYYKTITDQNYTLEQFLVTAGSNLEFSGAFDLVPADDGASTTRELALYDYIKSEKDPEWKQLQNVEFPYRPIGIDEYTRVYTQVKKPSAELEDNINSNTGVEELKKAYIKFTIEPTDNASMLKSF